MRGDATLDKTERNIRNTVGSLAIEEMFCTDEEIQNLKDMLAGKVSANQLIADIKKKYAPKQI